MSGQHTTPEVKVTAAGHAQTYHTGKKPKDAAPASQERIAGVDAPPSAPSHDAEWEQKRERIMQETRVKPTRWDTEGLRRVLDQRKSAIEANIKGARDVAAALPADPLDIYRSLRTSDRDSLMGLAARAEVLARLDHAIKTGEEYDLPPEYTIAMIDQAAQHSFRELARTSQSTSGYSNFNAVIAAEEWERVLSYIES